MIHDANSKISSSYMDEPVPKYQRYKPAKVQHTNRIAIVVSSKTSESKVVNIPNRATNPFAS